MRGPLLYCVEAADHPGVDVRLLQLPVVAALTPEHRPDLRGGVVVLRGTAHVAPEERNWSERLYALARPSAGRYLSVPLTAIPYYAWANRAAGPMQFWLREQRA